WSEENRRDCGDIVMRLVPGFRGGKVTNCRVTTAIGHVTERRVTCPLGQIPGVTRAGFLGPIAQALSPRRRRSCAKRGSARSGSANGSVGRYTKYSQCSSKALSSQ